MPPGPVKKDQNPGQYIVSKRGVKSSALPPIQHKGVGVRAAGLNNRTALAPVASDVAPSSPSTRGIASGLSQASAQTRGLAGLAGNAHGKGSHGLQPTGVATLHSRGSSDVISSSSSPSCTSPLSSPRVASPCSSIDSGGSFPRPGQQGSAELLGDVAGSSPPRQIYKGSFGEGRPFILPPSSHLPGELTEAETEFLTYPSVTKTSTDLDKEFDDVLSNGNSDWKVLAPTVEEWTKADGALKQKNGRRRSSNINWKGNVFVSSIMAGSRPNESRDQHDSAKDSKSGSNTVGRRASAVMDRIKQKLVEVRLEAGIF